MEARREELCHYGIKGQKWGIRRFQNEDGTLTAEGKKRARKEYREDNKKAYKKGKKATEFGKAAVLMSNRALRYAKNADKALEKDPAVLKKSTVRKMNRSTMGMIAASQLIDDYREYERQAKEHCDELIKKYGDEAITKIKYKEAVIKNKSDKFKEKIINEKHQNFGDYVYRGFAALASYGLSEISGEARPEVQIADQYEYGAEYSRKTGIPMPLVMLMLRGSKDE